MAAVAALRNAACAASADLPSTSPTLATRTSGSLVPREAMAGATPPAGSLSPVSRSAAACDRNTTRSASLGTAVPVHDAPPNVSTRGKPLPAAVEHARAATLVTVGAARLLAPTRGTYRTSDLNVYMAAGAGRRSVWDKRTASGRVDIL